MQTSPLAKAITTLEGQLVLVTSAVLAAGAALDPSVLPPKWAAAAVVVEHVALLIQRGVIKARASGALQELADHPSLPELLKVIEEELGHQPVAQAPAPVAVGTGSDDTEDYNPEHGLAPGDQS